ncbi:MAG: PhnD/SsuA/transferrin family substrate-binding protein, partial [Culicoidibacterales bacterium]
MKKFGTLIMAMVLMMGTLVGCGSTDSSVEDSNTIETLKIAFVPSKEPQEIITATEPLKEMLIAELATQGYTVNDIEITVGTSFETVGEALSAGTVDIGFIPGGTYVLYDDGAEPILTATRDGLSIESAEAIDWNANKPTEATDEQVTFYRSL